nr:protein-ADP-ribose hydrolase [Maliibacterium massiliense]
MDQQQRRVYLIQALLSERPDGAQCPIPDGAQAQRRLLRALMNVRPPQRASEAFLAVQDAYLQQALRDKGITDIESLAPARDGLYLWRGDITTLKVDAIVNAANAQLLGCFQPCHSCIDNAIHTYAGVQLRLACAALMRAQGHDEPTGQAKITPAFNLPSKFVLHSVGPIVSGPLTQRHCDQFASCYRACLALAAQHGAASIAFCCISTGVFHFPNERAAQIAIDTVRAYRAQTKDPMKVVFNVFTQTDADIYRRLLRAD